MRYARRFSVSTRWRAGVLPLCAALAFGCHGEVGDTATGRSRHGDADLRRVGSDERRVAPAHRVGHQHAAHEHDPSGQHRRGGDTVPSSTWAMFPVDHRSHGPVPAAAQRSSTRAFSDIGLAFAVQQHGADPRRVRGDQFRRRDQVARRPRRTPARPNYLNGLATEGVPARPHRPTSSTRLTDLYTNLKSQIVNGYQVTLTVEDATGIAVYGALHDAAASLAVGAGRRQASTLAARRLPDGHRAGVQPLVFPDRPAPRRHAGRRREGRDAAGEHRRCTSTASSSSQTSKDWLRHVMEMYFFLNQLPAAHHRLRQVPDRRRRRHLRRSRRVVAALPGRRRCGTARSWT